MFKKKNTTEVIEETVVTEEQALRTKAMEEVQTTFNEDVEGLFEDVVIEHAEEAGVE